MGKRNITGAVGRGRKADADKTRRHGVERIGFGIDRDDAREGCFGNPCVELSLGLHALIGIAVEDLCDRKKLMFLRADAVVTLPGGYGTMDEATEVLYWAKLGLHNKPLVLVNTENFYDDKIS